MTNFLIKALLFSVSFVLPGFAPLQAENNQPPQIQDKPMNRLANVGHSYINLLNKIGAAQNLSHEKEAASLCAPTCKKVVNGAVWFEEVSHFVPQLLSTGEKVGFWRIETLDVIPAQDGRTVVVRFLVHTEKAGVWNTLVILRCTEDLKIAEINEVFNSYEGNAK